MFDWREERTVCVDRGQLLRYCPVLTVYSLETPGKQKVLEESEMNGKRESTVTGNVLSNKSVL